MSRPSTGRSDLLKDDEEDKTLRQERPRRGGTLKNYKDNDEMQAKDDEDEFELKDSSSSDGLIKDTDDESEDESEEVIKKRRQRHMAEKQSSRRTSSRSNKFSSSMAEPPPSLTDLFKKKNDLTDTEEDEGEVDVVRKTRARGKAPLPKKPTSPLKSPARRHAQRRRCLAAEDTMETSDETTSSEDEEEDEEPLKVQRIIASRTETLKDWREICRRMNTSEIHFGSRWFQSEDEDVSVDNEVTFEERFLVKWADLSYFQVSWESQHDLLDQVPDAKKYLATFFRKSVNGILYSQDERCDGDYFDPAFREIERILEVQLPEQWDENTKLSADTEDGWDAKSFGMIMDKADPDFDNGTGRQFLIKWCNRPYTESTYEFERDLIMNEIEYKDPVKAFLRRKEKPTKTERRLYLKKGEAEYKRLYEFFGDKSKLSEIHREEEVEKYKQQLQEIEYKNGGMLRDYQAEGVAWIMANFVNQRSCILADEMGLGKTLQTAASATLLASTLNRGGPILIVAPLSTLTHWYREFSRWTDLNAVVYHGVAEDRQLIREYEFVYECDRPQTAIAFNQMYLKKCVKKNSTKTDSPWMVDVVITSPEMMIADDAAELSAVHWEVLVVDEAHRLKNYSSKLAVGLRDEKFTFRHRILLTGTPIQNDVQEFWTLLNFIDPASFSDLNNFLERYGEMKSKERVDELHEEIRPYILRRLKEDVERSVPPKEETLIEVELTVAQKQYYRALYEKNVKFLHKNKTKAMDGPSLNNLAMQLRKCCNHIFLLKGVEAEFRRKQEAGTSEVDFMVNGSGKLVLLDKLLPRLKEEGHRVLLFSQFKIMLDILEDYLHARGMKFERIDGSITGNRRQQAIDRFQAPSTDYKEAPFVMLLSTRAGGVGITLTAADTCIIVDSDWNPQNDLQAQARCHRIGQTKSVKVYRLLTRKTYEMQMFHMSSLKMGLDQAVLKGFESGASGEGALSKEEVEKLLRHGAYDIFNEDRAGQAEEESNNFVQQDIDSILQRRSHTVVHENTGSMSGAAGGTFSKASFKAKTPDPSGASKDEEIDIEDPDFWKKMIGEGSVDDDEEITGGRRQRTHKNYSETEYKKQLAALLDSDSEQSLDEDEVNADGNERFRWGGSLPSEWTKDDVESLVKSLSTFGYNRMPWKDFVNHSNLSKEYDLEEVKRMCWTVVLTTLLEAAEEDSEATRKREAKAAEKLRDERAELSKTEDGGVLAADHSTSEPTALDVENSQRKSFKKHLREASIFLQHVLSDAVTFASDHTPRDKNLLDKIFHKTTKSSQLVQQSSSTSMFATSVWPSLKSRGWTAEVMSDGNAVGKTRYSYKGKEYYTIDSVLAAAQTLHPELRNVVETSIASSESDRSQSMEACERERAKDLALSVDQTDYEHVRSFLERFGSIQLIYDRVKSTHIRLRRKILTAGTMLCNASTLVRRASDSAGNEGSSIDQLAKTLAVDKRLTLPHPMWTSRHDAVLIHAIDKHGWIDEDGAVRAIGDDPSVKWGAPFSNTEGDTFVPISNDHIAATAIQAAFFCTHYSDMISELKGFDQCLLIRTYGLTRQSNEKEAVDQSNLTRWVVDLSRLQLVKGSSRSTEPAKLVDLPPKKDLVKRAKAILSKVIVPPILNKQNNPIQPTHDYTVLDQMDMANVFLAEMLRGILREPWNSKHYKKLCCLSSDEARRRADTLLSQGNGDLVQVAANLRRIAEHIDEVKCSLFSQSATQYKNVIRAILGEEVQKPRNKDGESLFPPRKNYSVLQTSTSRGKEGIRKSGLKLNGRPAGEKAIDLARQRLFKRYGFNDGTCARDESELELTEIETLILFTACAIGIPVWNNDWRNMLDGVPPSSDLGRPSITWNSFGNFLSNLAEKSFQQAKDQLKERREQTPLINGVEAAQCEARGAAQAALDFANQTYRATEAVASQAREYSVEPETLAKKSIMLIAKIRQHMSPLTTSTLATRSDQGLGPKILHWLGKEVTRWAGSLDILDENGLPLALTAVEFLHELPEPERQAIEISSVIDKKGCRMVIGQAALMTRIRSLFSVYDSKSLLAKIAKAVNNLKTVGDPWDKQPDGWSLCSDVVLLKRLMYTGLTDLLLNETAWGQNLELPVLAFSNPRYNLSRGDIQLRANQLARELHSSEEAVNSFRILEECRNEHTATAASTIVLKAGHQTGLHSYFTARSDDRPEHADDEVQILSSATSQQEPVYYSDVEIIDPPQMVKRKLDGNKDSEKTDEISSEKKQRIS